MVSFNQRLKELLYTIYLTSMAKQPAGIAWQGMTELVTALWVAYYMPCKSIQPLHDTQTVNTAAGCHFHHRPLWAGVHGALGQAGLGSPNLMGRHGL